MHEPSTVTVPPRRLQVIRDPQHQASVNHRACVQEAVERQGKPQDSEVMAIQLQQKSTGQPEE